MTAELVVRVHGVPAPQGSFFARCVGKGRTHRAIAVPDNKATEPWRRVVMDTAEDRALNAKHVEVLRNSAVAIGAAVLRAAGEEQEQ